MPVVCNGYFTEDGRAWTHVKETSANVNEKHAEQQSYERIMAFKNRGRGRVSLAADTRFFFRQNAFPCGDCKAYFLASSQSRPFIFLVTENQGNYASEWGFPDIVENQLPQLIFLYKSKAFIPGYVTRTEWRNVAPAAGSLNPHKWVRTEFTITTLTAINPQTCQKPEPFPDYPALP